MVCTFWTLILDTVSNIWLWFGPAPNVTPSPSPVPNMILYSRLGFTFVTLSVGYGTQCNNILARHRCTNIAVTTTNSDNSAKCYTVVHDSICCNKYNSNDWSYHGNSVKCSTIVVTALLLWSYPGNSAKCISR